MLGQYIFTAAMSIGPDREGLLNEVYESEHIPALEKVPGVIGIHRYRRVEPADTFYLAVYEIATTEVPSGPFWLSARDLGRWPTEVRPYTRGLLNGLYSWRAGFGSDGPTRIDVSGLLLARVEESLTAQPGVEARVEGTLRSLAACPGVIASAHYVDVANGSHILVAGLRGEQGLAPPGTSAMGIVLPIARPELYVSI